MSHSSHCFSAGVSKLPERARHQGTVKAKGSYPLWLLTWKERRQGHPAFLFVMCFASMFFTIFKRMEFYYFPGDVGFYLEDLAEEIFLCRWLSFLNLLLLWGLGIRRPGVGLPLYPLSHINSSPFLSWFSYQLTRVPGSWIHKVPGILEISMQPCILETRKLSPQGEGWFPQDRVKAGIHFPDFHSNPNHYLPLHEGRAIGKNRVTEHGDTCRTPSLCTQGTSVPQSFLYWLTTEHSQLTAGAAKGARHRLLVCFPNFQIGEKSLQY